ncbi:cytochrome c biogenesis protein [Aestuariivivens marinum]|uniref:cytochrome c biogenesis protein n=1 Tax=Aestuariivivens marinum TaxID=2913555 RepID=UPI001F55AAC6|nr:cytochrome c biogenesis protein CcsA [Aestuariivivens marinum]
MRSLLNVLFSSKIAMLFLVLFILIIGAATFIEDYYDTPTAQQLIYQARWFELLMLVLVVQFIGNQVRRKAFSWEKLPQLLFHFSFLLLIIGGGITRYFGYEGHMHILENEAVDVVYTKDPYLQVRNADRSLNYTSEYPLFFSQLQNNHFELTFAIPGNESLVVSHRDYQYNARELYTKLNTSNDDYHLDYTNPDQQFPNALLVTVTYRGESHDTILFYDEKRFIQQFKTYSFGDLELEMVYGPKPVPLPFALKLKNFTLSKYPGTNIPSASESEVLLMDQENQLVEEFLIAKNKVLDYRGYRFFQTSYDDNEEGTILSINYDYYGTRITYAGYILMTLGALLVLFSKRSGFGQLDRRIKLLRNQRKSLTVLFLVFLAASANSYAQQQFQNPVSKAHADSFAELLVQTHDGRFASVHSLATDVVHKITGKDHFEFPGKGKMDAMQLFLDIQLDPNYWIQQDLIVVRENALRDILGVNQKHLPFIAFLNADRTYRLEYLVQKAFQKKAADQSSLDREIIKVTERVTIFDLLVNGTLLKVFPEQDSNNHNWINWNDSIALKPLAKDIISAKPDFSLKSQTYNEIMRSYFVSTLYAKQTNDYQEPEKWLTYIKQLQRELTPDELLPSTSKIKREIFYNKSDIFGNLKYIFALLGIVLLSLVYVENFSASPRKILNNAIRAVTGLLVLAFAYQTFGMGLRWHLGGHAPWSNGYEVLLLVAWGSMLAGFSVMKYSKINLAATALLTFLILMTAGHSYYDPQLTNLNPVLKSVWLIIHVAVITIGYGFLALSFILGLVILATSFGRRDKNKVKLSLLIQELTLTNEKLVVIGMFLTAIGTFIGCVWANESWGSYWSWNAKQTWSLIIVLVYGVVLHFKYIPGLQSPLAFNIGSMLSFGSVLMTFIGVNYYFTKGLHSYASDDPPIFPMWSWVAIALLFVLISAALWNERQWQRKPSSDVY